MMNRVYSYPRYLAAKKSVDDRALNLHVWESLATELSHLGIDRPIRILEIGAGIGTMIERMLEWGILSRAHYTALDAAQENIEQAMARLPAWARKRGYKLGKLSKNSLKIENTDQCLTVDFINTDLFDFLRREPKADKWDLLVAHAFLDLIDIPSSLPKIFPAVKDGGLFYFSLNFDGATLFEPTIEETLDETIQALYHHTMDERLTAGKLSGDSRAGRHLFRNIHKAGGQILDAGASDWVVYPGADGYPEDEAYFLHFIIHTVENALVGRRGLDESSFTAWVAERHAQIERGELVYIAHQLDFLGRVRT